MATIIVVNEDETKVYIIQVPNAGIPPIIGQIDYLIKTKSNDSEWAYDPYKYITGLKFADDEWLCGVVGYPPYVLSEFTLVKLGEIPPLNASFVRTENNR